MPEGTIKLPLLHSLRLPKLQIHRPPMLVLLHGLGGNDEDFLKLATEFDDRFLIISARAPFAQTARSAVWFNVNWLGGTPVVNSTQAEYSRATVSRFIKEAVQAYKTHPDQVFLMGFSQGAVICLSLMMTEPQLLAGSIAISGQLLPEIRTMIASPEKLKGKPILLIHGSQDAFYPISLGRASSALLSTLPVVLEYQEYFIGHLLTPEILQSVQKWLERRLDLIGVVGMPEQPGYKVQLASAHLKVRNLERSIAFYGRFLGMRIVEQTGKTYAFLSNNDSHHVIALQNVGMEAPFPSPQSIGLLRISFEVPDQVSFARIFKSLRGAGVVVSTIDHLICWSLQFEDPDGNGLEVFLDTRNLPGRSDLWQGRDLPLSAEQILSVLQEE